jgi:hypothetical protein
MERGGSGSDRGAQSRPSGERATSGQGGAPMDRGSAGQSQMDRGQAQQPRAGQDDRGRTGQTQMDRGPTQQPRAGQTETQPPRAGQTGTQQQRTGEGRTGATSGSASLSTEQRTRIRETVLKGGGAARVSRTEVNFNISVGTTVPRTVRLVPVPATIVEIHPAWRGYLYFVVEEEIIIVEPGTLRIVAVIA